MAQIKEVTKILVDNLKLRGSVLPISQEAATKWAKDLNLPKGGDTILYTGNMYQIIPYINKLVKTLELFEGTFFMNFTVFGRMANRFVNVSKFMGGPNKEEVKTFNNTLTNMAKLLQKSGSKFGYLYEDDLYAGALTYDLGADDVTLAQAKKVYENLKKHGVKRVITVDPHTTHMLREVYPKILPEFDIVVKSYIEVLAKRGLNPLNNKGGEVAIHDSCVYARHENVVGEPRELLSKAGVNVKEPFESKKITFCCGGPAESLFPSKALEVGKKRMAQLCKECDHVTVMCPICNANLKRSATNGTKITDFADYISEFYLEN
ncbi:MAG: (Fe-S)-binding protein [bacterium]|nr:(Fe-S)-binding protein [bacterium]MBU1917379.1 (Fe-S)-binding protein [bacterium]